MPNANERSIARARTPTSLKAVPLGGGVDAEAVQGVDRVRRRELHPTEAVHQDHAVANSGQSRSRDRVLAVGKRRVGHHVTEANEDRKVLLLEERRRPAKRALQAHEHRDDVDP